MFYILKNLLQYLTWNENNMIHVLGTEEFRERKKTILGEENVVENADFYNYKIP